MALMQEAIEVQGLRKAYGDVEAVAGVSFSVGVGGRLEAGPREDGPGFQLRATVPVASGP